MSRDQALVLGGLGALTASCWAFVVRAGEHAHHGGPGTASLLAFGVMMAGMMAPSTAGRLLALVGARRRMDPSRSAAPAAALFLCGYLAAWMVFSALAAFAAPALQTFAQRAAAVSGALLLAAGLYQLTPLKRACLDHCRASASAPAAHEGGALGAGLADGVFCVGSCWALMLLPLAATSPSLAAMAAVTAVVMTEKLAPRGERLAVAAGALLLAAGAVTLAAA